MNTLNILGVDTIETALAYDAVYNIERIIITVDRTCTAYTYLYATARYTTLYDIDTCHASLKGLADIFNGLILEGFVAHDRYRTGQIGLADASVADNDNLVQHVVILCHCYLNGITIAYCQFLTGKSYV